MRIQIARIVIQIGVVLVGKPFQCQICSIEPISEVGQHRFVARVSHDHSRTRRSRDVHVRHHFQRP